MLVELSCPWCDAETAMDLATASAFVCDACSTTVEFAADAAAEVAEAA
jgi:hypothetical protein